MGDTHLWSFLIAITLLSVTPGVDTLLVIRNTTRGGVGEGIMTSLGICLGLFVHATISALGISLILLQSAWVFSALKLAGAGYLVWLGLNSLQAARAGYQLPVAAVTGSSAVSVSAWRALREGLLCNVLNPKTIIFYMAFLPQFIAPGEAALSQSLWLAGIHFVIANGWQIGVAVMVGRAGQWLGKRSVARWLNGVTGSVLVLLGVKLALTRQSM
ncbi:LysE family translocator [Halomonas halocynthiae]|uniref:LysE family translocator n=1 Tax=Halomonas halocynthiae TaxID=176290 RepID=UPI0004832293|nr:LysE family translocator [Halomonas halocynthiae]